MAKMPSVELTDQEWQQVINMIATQPWTQANPLLMKIGGQLQARQAVQQAGVGVLPDANGKEVRHE
jgi:hypothetical protein